MSDGGKKKKKAEKWQELEEIVRAFIQDLKNQEDEIKALLGEEEMENFEEDVPIGTIVAFSK